MNEGIAEAIDKLSGIIRIQSEIIDRLAAEVLQHAAIAAEELDMIEQAAKLQEDARKNGLL